LSLADFLLDASRVLIGLGLSVFIGGTLAAALSRRESTSRADEKMFFLEGNTDGALGRAKFVAAGALLLGVLLETQVLGSSLPRRHVWRAVVLFLIVASHVYAVMVVQPKARYYAEKLNTFEESSSSPPPSPWSSKLRAASRKNGVVSVVGFLLALVALVLG
jgi:hypothetical protein